MVIQPSFPPAQPGPPVRSAAEPAPATPEAKDKVDLGQRPPDADPAQIAAVQALKNSGGWPHPDARNPILNDAALLVNAAIGNHVLGPGLSGLHAPPAVKPFAAVPQLPLTGPSHAVEVVRRIPAEKWAWMELLRDPDPHFKTQSFLPRQRIHNQELLELFGTSTPSSGDIGLLYAGDPPPGVKRHETPVVLVHGASKNGQFWQEENDLAEQMRLQGFSVYAVSFAHSHDDNNFWAQGVANAIDRVKQVTGQSQVDLVAHSKGGVPARMYCSSFGEPWMTGYRGDVRRLALVAAPNGGIDFSFRHPAANLLLADAAEDPKMNAPMTWDAVLGPMGFKNRRKMGFGKDGPDYFPGQRQLLARWDRQIPLPVTEPDWYTSYYGGQGFVSQSRGIDHFIEESGHFMDRLQQSRIDPRIQVILEAGDDNVVDGFVPEYSGQSDGLLFLKSAVKLPYDTNICAEGILHYGHKALLSEHQPQAWLMDKLGAATLTPLTKEQRQQIEAKV